MIGAIVLAGGRSERFGRDKLAEVIDGRPLLAHAIDSVQAVAVEIVVVAPVGVTPKVPDGVVVAHDDRQFEGPLIGLLAGLHATRASYVLVIGGDMPSLLPPVAEALLNELRSGAAAAVLEQAHRARPLPMALLRQEALPRTTELIESGERRLRALQDALEAVVIPEDSWRLLDPGGRSALDIDTPADLP